MIRVIGLIMGVISQCIGIANRWDFSSDLEVKTVHLGSVPSQGTKIPEAA